MKWWKAICEALMVSGGVVNQFASEEWPLRAGLMSCPAYYSHLICDSSHPHYCPQCTMLGLVRGRVIYYLEAGIINYKLSGHKHCTIKVKSVYKYTIHANRARFWSSIGQCCQWQYWSISSLVTTVTRCHALLSPMVPASCHASSASSYLQMVRWYRLSTPPMIQRIEPSRSPGGKRLLVLSPSRHYA